MANIKPCPFCGAAPEASIHFDEVHGEGFEKGSNFEFAVVRCRNNGCQIKPQVGSTASKGEALEMVIKRWNIRK